jgi:hypothetical protein
LLEKAGEHVEDGIVSLQTRPSVSSCLRGFECDAIDNGLERPDRSNPISRRVNRPLRVQFLGRSSVDIRPGIFFTLEYPVDATGLPWVPSIIEDAKRVQSLSNSLGTYTVECVPFVDAAHERNFVRWTGNNDDSVRLNVLSLLVL